MIDAAELRRQVRVILSARPAATLTAEGYIAAGLSRFFPERIHASDMQSALEWNEARGWVEKRWNADEERNEWMLSGRGRIKEGLA